MKCIIKIQWWYNKSAQVRIFTYILWSCRWLICASNCPLLPLSVTTFSLSPPMMRSWHYLFITFPIIKYYKKIPLLVPKKCIELHCDGWKMNKIKGICSDMCCMDILRTRQASASESNNSGIYTQDTASTWVREVESWVAKLSLPAGDSETDGVGGGEPRRRRRRIQVAAARSWTNAWDPCDTLER